MFKNLIDSQGRTEKTLVLMNFNDKTNPGLRSRVRNLFGNASFVTELPYFPEPAGYQEYVRGLRSHPFCLAPRGNGIDTHRIWESLYAGCIPVVQNSPAFRDFADLPIFFVKRWEDARDESNLATMRDQIYKRTWDLRKLTISYWYRLICDRLAMTN